MKIEIWLQSSQPKWKEWSKLGSVKLKEALYLSMDVCPSWYENNILDTVEHYYGTSIYHRSVSKEEFEDIQEVYEVIEAEYNDRLKIARSWSNQQDWVIGMQPSSPDDITQDIYVDLRRFLKFAFLVMQFENETDSIPLELRGIQAKNSIESNPVYMASDDWKSKARELATEMLTKNPNLSLDDVSEAIEEAFSSAKIFSSRGKRLIAASTIKREALSKDAWFSNTLTKLLK